MVSHSPSFANPLSGRANPTPMDSDRLLLVLAVLAFAGGALHALISIRSGVWKAGRRGHLIPMFAGFALQTAFLYLRGQVHGRCPLTNVFEVLIFISWSIVLLYFLVGSAYRLSLLGVFTAPMVALVQVIALLLPLDITPQPAEPRPVNPWLELHAAVALIAYAAFALACVTGVMYLLQEHLLKKHRIGGLFYQLPPIQGLAHGIQRLALLGFILLTAGLAFSFRLEIEASNPKLIFSWVVWALYALICFLMWRHVLSPRQTAWLAVTGFLLPFISLWIVT